MKTWILALFPFVVLCTIGFLHLGLFLTRDLSPWAGGGFGMYSHISNDTHKQITAITSEGETLHIQSEFNQRYKKVLAMPNKKRLADFAQFIACIKEVDEVQLVYSNLSHSSELNSVTRNEIELVSGRCFD